MRYQLKRMTIDLDYIDVDYYLPDKCIIVCTKIHEWVRSSYSGREDIERTTYLYYLEPMEVS